MIHEMTFSWFCGLQELFEAFEAEGRSRGQPRLMITAAVSAGKETIDAGYEIAEISKYASNLFFMFNIILCLFRWIWADIYTP